MIISALIDKINNMNQAVLSRESEEWVQEKCPYCGRIFSYARDSLYRPHTCDDYQCTRKDLHPALNRDIRILRAP